VIGKQLDERRDRHGDQRIFGRARGGSLRLRCRRRAAEQAREDAQAASPSNCIRASRA
jgi:hypothetical protein